MLSKKVEEALNAQVNAELWSAYYYLSMSAHFTDAGLNGFAHWFRKQAREEQDHAMKLYDYIHARNGKVLFAAVAQVPSSWTTPLSVFEDTLTHEKKVTAMIHKIVALATEEKDYATVSFLNWFVDEQVEEEATALGYVEALKFIDGDKIGVYMLNNELGSK